MTPDPNALLTTEQEPQPHDGGLHQALHLEGVRAEGKRIQGTLQAHLRQKRERQGEHGTCGAHQDHPHRDHLIRKIVFPCQAAGQFLAAMSS